MKMVRLDHRYHLSDLWSIDLLLYHGHVTYVSAFSYDNNRYGAELTIGLKRHLADAHDAIWR